MTGSLGPKPNPRPLILHVDSETNIPYRLAESDNLFLSGNLIVDTLSATNYLGLALTGLSLAEYETTAHAAQTYATTSIVTSVVNVTTLTSFVNVTTLNAYETTANLAQAYIANPFDTANQILYYDGSIPTALDPGPNSNTYLQYTGSQLIWTGIAGSVSIPVPINQGGTNTTTVPPTNGNVIYFNKSVTAYDTTNTFNFAAGVLSVPSISVTTPISVLNGGTGQTSLQNVNIASLGGTGVFELTSHAATTYLPVGSNVTSLDGTGIYEVTSYSRFNYLLKSANVTGLAGTGIFETTAHAATTYIVNPFDTANQILYYDGVGPPAALDPGPGSNTYLKYTGTNLIWTAIGSTLSQVPVLPSEGGTGATALGDISVNSFKNNVPLSITRGGTGQTSLVNVNVTSFAATSTFATTASLVDYPFTSSLSAYETTGYARTNYFVKGASVTSLAGTSTFVTTNYNATSLYNIGVYETTSYARTNYFTKGASVTSLDTTASFATTASFYKPIEVFNTATDGDALILKNGKWSNIPFASVAPTSISTNLRLLGVLNSTGTYDSNIYISSILTASSTSLSSTSATLNSLIQTPTSFFSSVGDARSIRLLLKAETSDGTETPMYLNGSSTLLIIPSSTTWHTEVKFVARTNNSNNKYAAFHRKCLITRTTAASSTIIPGFVQTLNSDIGSDVGSPPYGWNVKLSEDTTNGALSIKVTGDDSSNIRWLAEINILEINYP